jgi:hypothetical protein
MAGYNLPVNADATYADSVSDPSVKIHQQHHDIVASFVRTFDKDITPADGQTWVWDDADDLWKPFTLTVDGSPVVPPTTYATMPSGSIFRLVWNGSAWPAARPSTRTDVYFDLFGAPTGTPEPSWLQAADTVTSGVVSLDEAVTIAQGAQTAAAAAAAAAATPRNSNNPLGVTPVDPIILMSGTPAAWAASPYILPYGMPGVALDLAANTATIKVGDGVKTWPDLPSIGSGAAAGGGGNTYTIFGSASPRLNPLNGGPIPANASVWWVSDVPPVNMNNTTDVWFNGPGN